jgi:alpha-galactosidase/6-phospho-beta-glucosidase family protein
MDMRNVSELIIEKAIIHILDNRKENPVLIDFPLELTEDIYLLFERHIKNSINDESTRIAKFDGNINVVKECCKNIIESPDNKFVSESKEIAKYLFDAMKNSNISPANFAVCIYSVNNEKTLHCLKWILVN